ncbi:MAG TPA: DUF6624 domain-containing protein, partial [Pyrinomonadaceae bacterium]|nr:DUF6624 domain-containing protein [Pyrinomonadaceae bacterium]
MRRQRFSNQFTRIAFVLLCALMLALTCSAQVQNSCLTGAEAKKLIDSLNSPTVPPDIKKIRKELLQMVDERRKLDSKISADVEKNQALIPESAQMGERHLVRVCEILKQNGWLTKEALEDEGFDALLSLIGNNRSFALQRQLLPVLIQAVKKGYVPKNLIASIVDGIRVASGVPQIFGTQASIRANAIYLSPLLNDERVDEWRAVYGLPPLSAQIWGMENRYLRPVVKTPRRSPSRDQKQKTSETAILGINDEESDLVKVETNVVSLNVRVGSQDTASATLALTKDDFTVLEDGVEQDISSFAAVDKPFDLVLILDFSGSTVEKQSLIKKAAQRFVASARPEDRIAVVAFATEIDLVCDLTTNKSELNKKINDIDLNGSSPIWESVKLTYENVLKKESVGRRSAIVLMT